MILLSLASKTTALDVDFSGDSPSVVDFVSSEQDSLGILMPYTDSLTADLIAATVTQEVSVTPTSTLSITDTATSTSVLSPMRNSPTSLSTESIMFPTATPAVPPRGEILNISVQILDATSVLLTWTKVEAAIGYRLMITTQSPINRQRASAQQIIEVDNISDDSANIHSLYMYHAFNRLRVVPLPATHLLTWHHLPTTPSKLSVC